jgi:hypothetical protein
MLDICSSRLIDTEKNKRHKNDNAYETRVTNPRIGLSRLRENIPSLIHSVSVFRAEQMPLLHASQLLWQTMTSITWCANVTIVTL